MSDAAKPRLLFVSPRFLFPVDSGGKIRTTQILRGLKGRHFDVTLVCPGPAPGEAFTAELASICDSFVLWPASHSRLLGWLRRLGAVFSPLPIPVATDRSRAGRRVVSAELAQRPDVVVFDFPHAGVLAQQPLHTTSVLFTHNLEAEIFRRHATVARNPLSRALWVSQAQKMQRYEYACLRRFDAVVAVAERDKEAFVRDAGIGNVGVIPTGVDLDYFRYRPPGAGGNVVFTGSMDWLANVDGIHYMLEEVWPQVRERAAGVRMTVVGRTPPGSLVQQAAQRFSTWRFTDFVDDIRPYVHEASVFVIPLRVGGGTRLKVYQAMAMGCPVVSTTIGVEGLPVHDGVHYLRADTPVEIAEAIVRLGADRELRLRLSQAARKLVEQNFSFEIAAAAFETICRQALEARTRGHRGGAAAGPARKAAAAG